MIDVKIESDECSAKKSNYPYIGIHKPSDLIVVFTEKEGGISLNDGIFRERRFYEEEFTRFQGQITLSNK